MPRVFLALILALLTLATPAQARRVAVVVANQAYVKVPALANPLNDARAVAAAFGPGGLGFDQVEQISNADGRTLRRLPARLRELARGADTVVVYLAGHGMRDESRRNFFLPVDADIGAPADIEAEGLDIEAIVAEVKAAAPRVGLIVVDACRNNPFSERMGTRSIGRGLARRGSDGLDGVLIAYAADGGQVADDGRGGLSPFAAAFVKRVRQPGTRVLEMLDEVSDEVRTATAGRQTPTRDGNLRVSAMLVPVIGGGNLNSASVTARPVDRTDVEREAWDMCKMASVATPCRAYLASFPAGRFGDLVRTRLDTLAAQADAARPVVTTTAPTRPTGTRLVSTPPPVPPAGTPALSKPVLSLVVKAQKLQQAGDHSGALAQLATAASLPQSGRDDALILAKLKLVSAQNLKDNVALEDGLSEAAAAPSISEAERITYAKFIAGLASNRKDYRKAATWYDYYLSHVPGDVDMLVQSASVHGALNDRRKVVSLLGQAIDLREETGQKADRSWYEYRAQSAIDGKLNDQLVPAVMSWVRAFPEAKVHDVAGELLRTAVTDGVPGAAAALRQIPVSQRKP